MTKLTEFANAKLSDLEARRLRRILVDTLRVDGVRVRREDRTLVSFSCNDYLNLTHHPAVKRAAIEAIATYGAGAGASRLVTGNCPLFRELETRLAARKQTEACCLFGSGYLANTGTVSAIVGENDVVFIDSLAHSCLWTGARLARARTIAFRHNDVEHLAELIETSRKRHNNALIVTETVFSMDGDVAPVAELAKLAAESDAWLMTDDAHGLGILEQVHRAELQMGTLSKALGSYGGYACAAAAVIDLIKTRARTFVYSTGLPPASAAAALAALDIIESDRELIARPLAHANAFAAACGLAPAQSAIVPLVLGDEVAALEAQQILERCGFLVVAIRPPTVAPGTARLRFAFTAGHSGSDITRLSDIVRDRVLPLRQPRR